MTKTLLILNGQPVILSSGTDSLVHDNGVLAAGAEGNGSVVSQEDAKSLFDPGAVGKHPQAPGSALGEPESLGDGMRSNLVQVRVNGSDVPGFVLSQDKTGAGVQKIVGHSVNQQKIEYGLLPSDKATHSVDGLEKGAESGGFFQLHSDQVQRIVAKESGFADSVEEGCGNEVFALATNAELVDATGAHHGRGDGSTDGMQDANAAAERGQVIQVSEEGNQVQPRNLSTIVAFIQGEDGSTQTIELSPEEACKLNLPHLLGEGVATQQQQQQLIHQPTLKTEDLSAAAHSGIPDGQKKRTAKAESNEEGLGGPASVFSEDRPDDMGGNGSCCLSSASDAGEAEVNLGPFFLIPEYDADGSISMLQIRSSDSMPAAEVTTAETLDSVNDSQLCPGRDATEMSSLSFPHPNQNVQKISLNNHQPMKNHDTMKPKYIDWKTVTPKSMPKVSGSMYLRDIAKRTKFRNLTSFLDIKQTQQEMSTKNHVIDSVAPSGHFSNSVAGLSRAVNISPQNLVIQSAAAGFTLGSSSGGMLQSQQSSLSAERRLTDPMKVEDASLRLPPHHHHPASAASVLEDPAALPQGPCGDRALTIKVSTGPIYVTGPTVLSPPAATACPPQPAAAAAPAPSIKCVESTEAIPGCSQSSSSSSSSSSDSQSLTSIVYCSSSGGDETPFTVHLPGGDNTKPLGSSENPIQLVQQGNTFQALQPVQERQLEQITALLQQRRITAPPTTHHDEIYDPKTNMKIVYKVVFPEDVLHAEDEEEEGGVGVSSSCPPKEDGSWERPGMLEEKRRGRKPKDWRKFKPNEEEEVVVDVELVDESCEERKKPVSRTRSGRISRPPRHMMKDFKHLHPINFNNDDDKDRDASSVGYSDYEEHHQLDSDKRSGEPVVFEVPVPRRKKREVAPLTRIRYTCLTCNKLYMGRIEAHYEKFPDHRREHPLPPGDLKQSYSAIKTLADSAKPRADGGSEMNKSVLSPTPGTQASETSGEPGLPMETLTSQPVSVETGSHTELGLQNPQFDPPAELSVARPPGRGRGRRGRRGHRSRGRAKYGGPGRPAAASQPPASPVNMLEKILGSYSPEEIQSAVGKRLVQNLTPWQLLCFQSEGKDGGGKLSWQRMLETLQGLLVECKREFETQVEPLQGVADGERQKLACERDGSSSVEREYCPTSKEGGQPGMKSDMEQSAGSGEEPPSGSDKMFLGNDNPTDKACIAEEPGNVDRIKVCDYIASILGVASGAYRLKEQSKMHTSPCNLNPNPELTQESNEVEMANPSTVKRQLEMDDAVSDTSPKRIQGDRPGSEEVNEKPDLMHNANQSGRCNVSGIDAVAYPKKAESVDSMGKVLRDDTHDMDLSYSLPAQITSESSVSPNPLQTSMPTPSMLTTSEGTTSLSTCLAAPSFSIPFNNENAAAVGGTTLTMSHTSPCVTHAPAVTSAASGAPLGVAHFASHSDNPVSAILSSMDSSLIPTSTIPQVNAIQQMPLGDLDITAEDLPRLLSEGTGLVVGGNGDGGDASCDAPKLLDTSGDTTDLSEMLFKLQEATAGISQNQDPNLGPPVYQEQILPSTQQMNANSNQLITSQSLSSNSQVVLNTQGYSTVGQTINPHSAPNLSMKLGTSQVNSEPSMPRLTFTGALSTNPSFHNTTSLGQPVGSADNKVQQNMLNQASVQGPNVGINQSETRLESERERLNIVFSVSGLGGTEFEDLLKR